MSPLMTCKQGANYLGISRSLFWQKCRDGEIRYIEISKRCYRVRQADLDAFIGSKLKEAK